MTPSDESQFTERHYIDSLSVQDSIVPDSVLMTSTSFKNLEKLEWDLLADPSLQRYKLVNSDWVQADTMLYFSDTFDVSAYWSVVDTPFIDEGLLFVDSSEWFDTNYIFNNSEPYQDRNCNEIWDAAEPRVNNESDCANIGTFTEDADGGFCDRGNKIYDLDEEYISKDSDGDGILEKYFYVLGDKPNNLIVDYTDTENPTVLLEINLGDDITDRWGREYFDLIETIEFNDLKQQYVDDVDSLVTLFTREKIGHIKEAALSPDDYYITKGLKLVAVHQNVYIITTFSTSRNI